MKAAVGLIKSAKTELMKLTSLEEFKRFINDTFTNYKDESSLKMNLILRKFEFNKNIIKKKKKNRIILETPIIEYINTINTNKRNKLMEKNKRYWRGMLRRMGYLLI